jgi:hypothetical protein
MAVWWALGVLVLVAVGLPLTIGLATRGMADRPPKPLRPGFGKTGQWLHERYGLDWRACVRIQQAVARGERVGDPALEDPAHGLAALTVSGRAPGQRLLRIVGYIGMTAGAAVLVGGIVMVVFGHAPSRLLFFLWYGPLLMAQSGIRPLWMVRIQRRKAARALEVNRQAATARLWFGAEDRRCEGGASDSCDGGDRQCRRGGRAGRGRRGSPGPGPDPGPGLGPAARRGDRGPG